VLDVRALVLSERGAQGDADAGLGKEIESSGVAVRVAPTVMRNAADRAALAGLCLAFARDLADDRRA